MLLHINPTVQIPQWGNDDDDELADPPTDLYSSDEFRMYDFKVRRCGRGRAHDWTDCPYAHPGEKARRRDPLRFHYSGTPCPEFKKGGCQKADECRFAHGVFECWLHPERYRTQPCKDGVACRRRVCFFAHTPDQLRVVATPKVTSPRSILSPPTSPDGLVIIMRMMSLGSSSSEEAAMRRRRMEFEFDVEDVDVGWALDCLDP